MSYRFAVGFFRLVGGPVFSALFITATDLDSFLSSLNEKLQMMGSSRRLGSCETMIYRHHANPLLGYQPYFRFAVARCVVCLDEGLVCKAAALTNKLDN